MMKNKIKMKKLKKSIFNFISFFVLIILITNCNKKINYNTEIKGQIIDFYTNTPISRTSTHIVNENIDPSKQQLQYFDLLDSTNWIHTVNSDSNGNFNIAFNDIENDYCKLFVYNDLLISNECYIINTGGSTTNQVYVKHFRNIQIHVRNKLNLYDRVYMDIEIDPDTIRYNNGFPCCLERSYNLTGFNKDTIIHDRAIPGGMYRIDYYLHQLPQATVHNEIDIPVNNSQDTIKYNFDY